MVAAPLHDLEVLPDTLLGGVADLVRRGRLREAVRELETVDLADHSPEGSVAASLLAECRLAQGDLGAALALGDRLVAAGDHAWAHHARAELASATGEPDLAVERFAAVATGAGAHDLLVPWRADAALALLRVGRRAEALELARTQLDLALATGTPYDVALALRVLATTDPSRDPEREPSARLRQALDLLEQVEAGRLRAQIETDLAGLLLLVGARAEALSLLRSAEAYAGREDLWPLQSRVRRLLDRLGEAPRRAQSEALAVLTVAERRVALLALDGLTNRQIAERLAVTIKAIEGHLSKVYRKLGLASRTALVASFAPC